MHDSRHDRSSHRYVVLLIHKLLSLQHVSLRAVRGPDLPRLSNCWRCLWWVTSHADRLRRRPGTGRPGARGCLRPGLTQTVRRRVVWDKAIADRDADTNVQAQSPGFAAISRYWWWACAIMLPEVRHDIRFFLIHIGWRYMTYANIWYL